MPTTDETHIKDVWKLGHRVCAGKEHGRHLVVFHAVHSDVVVAAAEHADAGEACDVVRAAQRRLLHAIHLLSPSQHLYTVDLTSCIF